MVRTMFFSAMLLASSATLWQQHVPAAMRDQAPSYIDESLTTIDAMVSQTVSLLTRYGGPRHTVPPIAGGTPSLGEPVRFGQDGDIVTVYQTLTTADLATGKFDPKTFLNAELSQAQFIRARLDRALFDGARIDRALFSDVGMAGISARVASFTQTVFFRADLSSAALEGTVFDDSVFTGSRLGQAGFGAASLKRAIVRDSDATGAEFAGATLDHARIERTNLRRASFVGASLRGAVFTDSQLDGSQWAQADLSGADLTSSTGLSAPLLRGACGDQFTQLPYGLRLPPCDPVEASPVLSAPPAVAAPDAGAQRLAQITP